MGVTRWNLYKCHENTCLYKTGILLILSEFILPLASMFKSTCCYEVELSHFECLYCLLKHRAIEQINNMDADRESYEVWTRNLKKVNLQIYL